MSVKMKKTPPLNFFSQADNVPVKICNSWHSHIEAGKLRKIFKTQTFRSAISEQA